MLLLSKFWGNLRAFKGSLRRCRKILRLHQSNISGLTVWLKSWIVNRESNSGLLRHIIISLNPFIFRLDLYHSIFIYFTRETIISIRNIRSFYEFVFIEIMGNTRSVHTLGFNHFGPKQKLWHFGFQDCVRVFPQNIVGQCGIVPHFQIY